MVTDGMKESCHELIDNRHLNYHRYCQGPWLMERATVNTRKGGDWGEFENSNFDEVPFQSWSWKLLIASLFSLILSWFLSFSLSVWLTLAIVFPTEHCYLFMSLSFALSLNLFNQCNQSQSLPPTTNTLWADERYDTLGGSVLTNKPAEAPAAWHNPSCHGQSDSHI